MVQDSPAGQGPSLFGMPPEDYKKFLNFLAAHECSVDFRPFRSEAWDDAAAPQIRKLKLPEPGPNTAESA